MVKDICGCIFTATQESGHQVDDIELEERLLLQKKVPAVRSYSAGESGEKLTVFQNEIWRQGLRYFLG